MWGLKLNAEAAGLMLIALGSAFEVLSALNSSPWTVQNFGADERRAKSAIMYTYVGLGIALAIAGGVSLLVGSAWPLVGAALISGLMLWIYKRAARIGNEEGNKGWVEEGNS